jgi:hypothetical protein
LELSNLYIPLVILGDIPKEQIFVKEAEMLTSNQIKHYLKWVLIAIVVNCIVTLLGFLTVAPFVPESLDAVISWLYIPVVFSVLGIWTVWMGCAIFDDLGARTEPIGIWIYGLLLLPLLAGTVFAVTAFYYTVNSPTPSTWDSMAIETLKMSFVAIVNMGWILWAVGFVKTALNSPMSWNVSKDKNNSETLGFKLWKFIVQKI